ncbi:conserved hypothetical protein [gamma proteobacterium NOR5-3]|nr:conserved hypothetical protein [gamma proteobacterium NOR5-3]
MVLKLQQPFVLKRSTTIGEAEALMNKRQRFQKPLRFLVSMAAVVASVGAFSSEQDSRCTAQVLQNARDTFNQAIQSNDLDAMAKLLDPDVVLVTGTDSDQFIGRDRQLKLWGSDAEDPNRLTYLRESTEVSLSPLHPIAMELGLWTGSSADGDEVGGEYSAKWRCENGHWLLEAEIFMTTRCSGELCGP